MSSRTVLVTGASTGIGRACALHLDHLGWNVFAGVRKEADGRALGRDASARLVAVKLDVTDPASIEESVGRVADATGAKGLNGLVNNAGVTVQGPLEYLDLDDLRNQFEVNVIGQIAVTQAFLPALRQAAPEAGRIVFMSSIAGRASALPLIGPYSASKRALEALAESLRSELLPWNIGVSLVEPGSIATPIWEKGDETVDAIIEDLPEEGKARYERALLRERDLATQTGKRGIPPERVAAKVEHALTAQRPHFRYLVGADAKARAFMEPAVPTWVRDKAVGRMLGYSKRSS